MPYEIIEDGYEQPKKLKPFETIQFPIVRRVFPSLIANSLVSIQPMTAPSAGIFYMDGYANYNWDIEEELKNMPNKQQMRECFVRWIKEGRADALKRIVTANYPQYLEDLEKLLVLK